LPCGALDKNRSNRFARFPQKKIAQVPPLDTWAVELP